ncbi:unnamed protein product [Hapterophycus canaliculatus]
MEKPVSSSKPKHTTTTQAFLFSRRAFFNRDVPNSTDGQPGQHVAVHSEGGTASVIRSRRRNAVAPSRTFLQGKHIPVHSTQRGREKGSRGTIWFETLTWDGIGAERSRVEGTEGPRTDCAQN